MKHTVLALLLAAGTLISAQSFAGGIVHYGDENDLSWMYVPPSAKQFPADSGKPASQMTQIPHVGDENDLSWMYVPPSAKQFPADSGKPASQMTQIPHYDDENDLSWMYTPSTTKDSSASTQHAAAPTAPVR